MLNKIKNFFKVLVSRPVQFIYVVGWLWFALSVLLALIIFIPHILDLYSSTVLTVDAITVDSDMNFFLKFLIKLLVFLLLLWLLFCLTWLHSLLVVLLYIPFYPYINLMTDDDSLSNWEILAKFWAQQTGDWVFSMGFYASSFFWIAFVILAFIAFTEHWKKLWSLIYYGEKYDDESFVNETNYGGDWESPEESFDKSNKVDMSFYENDIEERLTVENKTQALKDLKQLLDDGAISTEEFNKLKRELLD